MNAVLRLNIIVSLMFVVALVVTVFAMLQQATKDINREVLTSVSFSHKLLTAASNDDELLNDMLSGHARHVSLDIIEPEDMMRRGPGSDDSNEKEDADEEVPEWFVELIPGLDELEEKQYFRYLDNGRVLRLQADSSDEVEEVWESVQSIFMLFILSALLSNIAIYFGVRHGIKPVSDFLEALDEIQQGRFTARLKQYSIKEINELSKHFNLMAHALEEAENDNKKLTHELMKIRETERAHLARELHDDLGQYLTGIKAQAYLVNQTADKPELVGTVAQQISDNCDAMQESFRQLIRDLHPVILEQLGLKQAITALVDNWSRSQNIKTNVSICDALPSFSDENSTHVYRIVQEALHNISRHSQADEVALLVDINDGNLLMRIGDNGIGLSGDEKSGLGMRSMRERARCLGGTLEFIKSAEGGCCVCAVLPVADEKRCREKETV